MSIAVTVFVPLVLLAVLCAACYAWGCETGYWQAAELEMCEWKYDEYNDKWDTSCDNAWSFNSDGPEENECKYCMYCGREISVAYADILEGK